LGGVVLDHNALIGDYNVGLYETFGKFQFVSSVDDWYNADLILIWHSNPVYTKIPCAHYLNEARYNGTQIVSISPDYNASGITPTCGCPSNRAAMPLLPSPCASSSSTRAGTTSSSSRSRQTSPSWFAETMATSSGRQT
jgi:hypothetical protein